MIVTHSAPSGSQRCHEKLALIRLPSGGLVHVSNWPVSLPPSRQRRTNVGGDVLIGGIVITARVRIRD
jgi:hypothetical protein